MRFVFCLFLALKKCTCIYVHLCTLFFIINVWVYAFFQVCVCALCCADALATDINENGFMHMHPLNSKFIVSVVLPTNKFSLLPVKLAGTLLLKQPLAVYWNENRIITRSLVVLQTNKTHTYDTPKNNPCNKCFEHV